jgi:hypothetical protein
VQSTCPNLTRRRKQYACMAARRSGEFGGMWSFRHRCCSDRAGTSGTCKARACCTLEPWLRNTIAGNWRGLRSRGAPAWPVSLLRAASQRSQPAGPRTPGFAGRQAR